MISGQFLTTDLSTRRSTMMRAMIICISTLCEIGLLVGCSSAPTARDVPPGALFTANILDDGTKLFTFSTHLPHMLRNDEERSVRRSPDPQEQASPRLHADFAQTNKKALQAMILENGYCRDGYVVLEMYEDRADYVMRGECRDAANESDRAKYPAHKASAHN